MAKKKGPKRPRTPTVDEYKMMARTLRRGFIDPEETDEFPERLKDVSKAQAIRDLRRAGYTVGKEIDYDSETGVVTDVRRTGKIARGFEARDGFNLAKIDEWTPAQKARVTRVYNEVKELTERPYHVYRPRRADHLARAQEATSPKPYPKELTVAFVPVAFPGETPEIKFTTTDITIKGKVYETETVEIVERDMTVKPVYWEDVGVTVALLRRNPKKAVALLHEAIGAREYTPMAGVKDFGESFDADALADEIERLQAEYPQRWPKFLLGVQAMNFPRRRDLSQYRTSKERAKATQRRKRDKDRRRFRQKTKGRKQ